MIKDKQAYVHLGEYKDDSNENLIPGSKKELNRDTKKFPDTFAKPEEYKRIDYCPFCGKLMPEEIC